MFLVTAASLLLFDAWGSIDKGLIIMAATTSSSDQDAWKNSSSVLDHFDKSGTGANKLLGCKWCGHSFSGSGSRAYSHLVDGNGVAKCKKIETHAQLRRKAAKLAADAEKAAKKRKVASVPEQMTNRLVCSTCVRPGL
jgi:hypothetical protein